MISIWYKDKTKGIRNEIHREIDFCRNHKTSKQEARELILYFHDFIDLFVNEYHSEDEVQE